jgi:hypothetical protein
MLGATVLVAAPAAFAQTPSPEVVVTPAPAAAASPTPAPGVAGWTFQEAAVKVWGPLIFGLLAISLTSVYYAVLGQKALDLIGRASRTGLPVRVVAVGAYGDQRPGVLGVGDGEAGGGAETTLQIEGPGAVEVGKSAQYKASPALPDGQELNWSVAPVDAGAVTTGPDQTATLTPVAAGKLELTAVVNTAGARPATLSIVAFDPSPAAVDVPFVGRGYGAVIIAIIAIAAVLALGLSGVLSGEALAVFFGALIGYLFTNRVQDADSRPNPPPATGGGAAGGGG